MDLIILTTFALTLYVCQYANNKGYKGGINYYFDNTGGTISQAAWDLLAPQSQVIICGQISIYRNICTYMA